MSVVRPRAEGGGWQRPDRRAGRSGRWLGVQAVAGLLAVAILAPPSLADRSGAPVTSMRASRQPGFFVPGARVVDGDTIEAWRDGGREGIGFIGIEAPQGNTRCGLQAVARLNELISDGVQLERDPVIKYDARRWKRMLYGTTPSGLSVSLAMVRSGFARAVWEGRERQLLKAAEEEARREGAGCLWRSGGEAQHRPLAGTGPAAPVEATTTSSVSLTSTSAVAEQQATDLPTGFLDGLVADGLALPTAFTFLPDGRILIAEKSGVVRVFKNGQVLPTPLIDISNEVNDYWDRGLIGITAHPNFASNGYVYLYYTYENDPTKYDGPKTARLTRVTVSGDTASPASEVTILGTTVGSSCYNFPVGTDCIPTDSPGHSTGNVRFAPDGTMFVTVGDGASWGPANDDAMRAQNLDWLAGKVLRITPSGQGISTNPFWNGSASANRSKVYAYGVRNAYRFNLRPGSGRPYIGDVGWFAWEEIDAVRSGDNLGWPCYEANAKSNYQTYEVCQQLYNQGSGAVRAPVVAYQHDGQSAAVTAGAFYSGAVYPSTYQGKFFYADYAQGWVKYFGVDSNDALTSGPTLFTEQAGAPVDIEMGPDGYLYYISIYPGELRKWCYGVTTCGVSEPPPSGSYPTEVAADAPLGYWRLGESSGTTAADASGNGRNGTYVNGPALGQAGLLTGDADTSVRFDGTDDHVEVPNAPVWNLTGDLTVEALINVTGGANYRTIVAKHDATGDVPTFEFRIATSTGKLQFVQKTTAGTFLSVSSNTVLTVGTTYHVAVTKSGSTVTLFINGALDKTSTFSAAIASNTRPVRIGTRDGTKPFGGRIDEVAIYDRALTATRVNKHYVASTTSPTGNQPPTATISEPSGSLTYKVGDAITYSGSGTDPEDGELPASALQWTVRLHHCPFGDCHTHPFLSASGTEGTFTVPDHGDDMYFEILLTVTDSEGLSATASVNIYPQTSRLTITSSPSGLTLFYDGFTITGPTTFDSVVGSTHSLDTITPQGDYVFDSWSDGGARQHVITTGATDRTITATFTDEGGTSSGSYPTEVAADTPLGYWRLGESSGTTAADASGNGRNGTYVNGPALGQAGLLTGDPDTSVRFDGTDDHVEIPNAPVWDLTGDLTIEALINVTGGANYRTIVAKHDATGDVPTFELRIATSTGKLQFVQKTTAGTFLSISSNTALTEGTTYHVAVTKSGSTVTLFINGAPDKTSTFSAAIASNTRPVRIGTRDGTKPFGGRIDEVAIYDRALTATRIQVHTTKAFGG